MNKDLLIVGAGPVGLYAWKIAKDLGLTGIIIESNGIIGGQISGSYPEKLVKNLPAVFDIQGKELVKILEHNARVVEGDFDLLLDTPFVDYKKTDAGFLITLNNKEYCFKKILLTCGFGKYSPLKLSDSIKFYKNLEYIPSKIENYKNKNVVIFGGGDSAIDWALELIEIAKSINLIHRRDEFRASTAKIEKLKKNNVKIWTPFEFVEVLNQKDENIKEFSIKCNETQRIEKIKTDLIIVQFGQQVKIHDFTNINLEINQMKRIIVDHNMKTNIDGLYAAGDGVYYESKARNMLYGFQEAVKAIVEIEKIINNRKVANNGWTL